MYMYLTVKKKSTRWDTLTYSSTPHPFSTTINFGVWGRLADIINHAKFQLNGLSFRKLQGETKIAILHWLEASPLQQSYAPACYVRKLRCCWTLIIRRGVYRGSNGCKLRPNWPRKRIPTRSHDIFCILTHFLRSKCPKMRLWSGLRHEPRWGSL